MTPQPRLATALALALAALALAGCSDSPSAAITVDFGGARPTAQADVEVDAGARFAASYYEAAGKEHPGTYTAFDQLVQWAGETETPLQVDTFSWGFCLGRLGGVPEVSGCQPDAGAYWRLDVDGNESFVGMADIELQGGERVAWTLVALGPAGDGSDGTGGSDGTASGALEVSVSAAPPTRNATVALAGTVSRPARLSLALAHGNATELLPAIDADGPWTAAVPLGHGNSTLTVTADDGAATAVATVTLVRLAKGTMQVDFKGLPGHVDRDDEVWFDPDSFPSAPHYAGQPVPHPPHANVHDLMVAWTAQTGVPVVYKPHASFGSQVMQIDGVGDPTTTSSIAWCYEVNAATASFGITDQPFQDGDVVAWHVGAC